VTTDDILSGGHHRNPQSLIQPSKVVEWHFRAGRFGRAARRWRYESIAYALGVDIQQVRRYCGPLPVEPEPESVVYLLGHSVPARDGEPVKIGYTENLPLRLETLQSGSVRKLYVLSFLVGGRKLEQEIHDELALYCIREDWFEMCQPVRDAFNERLGLITRAAA
jgi:Meiotically Up-regulated Gene 113 (MUG113) protein